MRSVGWLGPSCESGKEGCVGRTGGGLSGRVGGYADGSGGGAHPFITKRFSNSVLLRHLRHG